MMSRHFGLNSERNGAIAKRLRHAKNQLSVLGSFFNQFITDILTIKTRLMWCICICIQSGSLIMNPLNMNIRLL